LYIITGRAWVSLVVLIVSLQLLWLLVFGVGIVVSADLAVICVLCSGVLVIGDGLRCGGGGGGCIHSFVIVCL
jgi:hypothetical protein